MEKIKIRVNFGRRPIYAISVQCPSCKNWFDSVDILKYPNFLHNCADEEEVYRECLHKKVIWE